MKVLRTVEETGETVLLESIIPRWDYPVIEYHSCAEELFLVDGDMWLGNSGTMRPGSYLWRPAYYTHGPFYTRSGAVIIAWLESAVDSQYVDDPRRTPDQNRRAEARQDAGDGFERITLPRPHLRVGEGAVAIEGGEADALFALCLRKRRHTTQEGCVGNDLGRLLRTQIHVFSGKNVGQGIPGQDFEPFEILALQEFQRG